MRILKVFSFPLVVLASALIVSSCGETSTQTPAREGLTDIFGNDSTALFRGHQMGDLAQQVKEAEPGAPRIFLDTLVEYDYTYIFNQDTTVVDIIYTIDSYGLFEIQVDMYPQSPEGAKRLMDQIPEKLSGNYGEPRPIGIVQRWTTNSRSNNLVEITLSNESEDAGKPFISLNYLEPLPDEL